MTTLILSRSAVVVLLGGSLAATALAQQAKPTFEVASIKRNTSSTPWSQNRLPGGRFVATNYSLVQLIQNAYKVQSFQLINVPDWVRDTRFDITAKAEQEVSPDQLTLMLQTLLTDRFRLVIRNEQREMAMYTLVTDRSDGRLGPNLVKQETGCDRAKGPGSATPGSKTPPPGAMISRGCGSRSYVVGTAVRLMGAIVVDRTGLTGEWDYALYYAENLGQVTPDGQSVPDFSTALREQFGLKLQPGRGPVDVIVIESIQQPTEN